MKRTLLLSLLFTLLATLMAPGGQATESGYVFEAGHPSLQKWLLPPTPPAPKDNAPTPERVELGKKLFFDPRLSGDGTVSCASCHSPQHGWSDGRATGIGIRNQALGRASPTVVNTAYNSVQMWDGREPTLESQALGPMKASSEMDMDLNRLANWLSDSAEYRELFAKAYPGESIAPETVGKAIASFERTIISRNSPFDRWVQGDARAMTPQQIRGFKLFTGKANCEICHSAPNFTDNGFHNIGLASFGKDNPDMGRWMQRKVKSMQGAFKTPTLRDVEHTAPYFHDGSAATLEAALEHYNKGGEVKTNLSPNMKPLNLTPAELVDLAAFLRALNSPPAHVAQPSLPRD